MPTKLILVRHGQTSWNIQKRYLGWTDIGLDDHGNVQGRKTRSRFCNEKPDRLYSSDLSRAMDFAKIVFGSTPETLHGLREINFGAFEGLTYDDIVKKWPEDYDNWIKDPLNCRIPGGESVPEVKERVISAIRKIVEDNCGKVVAAVSHAGPIAIVMRELSGGGDFWSSWPEPACVNIIEFDKDRANILLRNDSSHLEA